MFLKFLVLLGYITDMGNSFLLNMKRIMGKMHFGFSCPLS